MIISPKHEFVFVHIPKCAGTSVRTQLLKSDAGAIALGNPGNHPQLGRIDFGHIQLDLLRQHFPQYYEQLCTYQSFAVIRDPLARFGSALRQILWQYEQRPMTLIPADELRDKALSMLDQIEQEIAAPSAPFIFFERQTRFVFDEGQQVTQHLIPVDLVADFIAHMSRTTQVVMDSGMRSNQNVDLRFKGLGNFAYRVNGFLRARLPLGLHTRIRKAALSVLSSKQDAAQSSGLLDIPEIQQFVQHHYQDDIALYRAVQARREKLAAQLASDQLVYEPIATNGAVS